MMLASLLVQCSECLWYRDRRLALLLEDDLVHLCDPQPLGCFLRCPKSQTEHLRREQVVDSK